MTFKLKKPPVIEAWIQASLEPTPESEWSWEPVANVLQSFGGDLDVFEHMPSFSPEAKKFDKDNRPTEIQIRVEPRFLRVRNKQRSKVVQIGHNELLVNSVRQDDEHYPGFEALKGSFLESLDRYRERIPVLGVHSIELHYVDLVVIPGLYDEVRELDDIFVGAPRLPEDPFGVTISSSWSNTFVNPTSNVPIQLTIEMLAPDGQDGKFRMDWHCWCPEISGLDAESITSGLSVTHDFLLKCFQAVFKPDVWKLFDPLP